MSIDDVKGCGDSAHHHADNQECEKDIRQEPAIARKIVSRPSEAVETDPTEDELKDHQQDPELGLVFAMVESDHRLIHRVGE